MSSEEEKCKERFKSKIELDGVTMDVPDFEEQAKEFTKLPWRQ